MSLLHSVDCPQIILDNLRRILTEYLPRTSSSLIGLRSIVSGRIIQTLTHDELLTVMAAIFLPRGPPSGAWIGYRSAVFFRNQMVCDKFHKSGILGAHLRDRYTLFLCKNANDPILAGANYADINPNTCERGVSCVAEMINTILQSSITRESRRLMKTATSSKGKSDIDISLMNEYDAVQQDMYNRITRIIDSIYVKSHDGTILKTNIDTTIAILTTLLEVVQCFLHVYNTNTMKKNLKVHEYMYVFREHVCWTTMAVSNLITLLLIRDGRLMSDSLCHSLFEGDLDNNMKRERIITLYRSINYFAMCHVRQHYDDCRIVRVTTNIARTHPLWNASSVRNLVNNDEFVTAFRKKVVDESKRSRDILLMFLADDNPTPCKGK